MSGCTSIKTCSQDQNMVRNHVALLSWLQLKFVFAFFALKCLKIQTFRDYCPFISGRCRYTERARKTFSGFDVCPSFHMHNSTTRQNIYQRASLTIRSFITVYCPNPLFLKNPSASPDTLVMIGPVNIFRLQSIEANGKHTACWITWPSPVKEFRSRFRIITMECSQGPPLILSISKTEEKRRLAAD